MFKVIFIVCIDLNKNLMVVLYLEYYLYFLYFFFWVYVGSLNGVRFVLLKKKLCIVIDFIKIIFILLNLLKEIFDFFFKINFWGKNLGFVYVD